MAGFYDLDYIIDLNESRAEQYLSGYQKVVDRLTNIIVIYSAITFFLVPIIQEVFLKGLNNPVLYISFGIFAILFLISVYYTIRLILPMRVAYLDAPEKYYKTYRKQYEQDPALTEAEVDKRIKGSYILELEESVETNSTVFKSKSSFFYNSLVFALLASVPYVICLGYHISGSKDSVQKVEIVNQKCLR